MISHAVPSVEHSENRGGFMCRRYACLSWWFGPPGGSADCKARNGCFNEPPNRPQHARLAGNSLHSCRRGAAVRSEKASRASSLISPFESRIGLLRWQFRSSHLEFGRCVLWRRRSRGAFSPVSCPRVVSLAANKKPAVGHPLRKACFLLASNREEGGRVLPGGVSLPYRTIGLLKKKFAEILEICGIWLTRMAQWEAPSAMRQTALPARHQYRLQIAEGVLKLLESYQYLDRF